MLDDPKLYNFITTNICLLVMVMVRVMVMIMVMTV